MSTTTTILSSTLPACVVATHATPPLKSLPNVQRKVSEGAQGIVYKGELGDCDVAIKFIPCATQPKKAAIQAEIDAWIGVQVHPNICTWYGWYRVPKSMITSVSTYALVTELCTGGELFDLLMKEGTFGSKYALDLYYQLFDAVNHIHTRGYIHCDIKLENIVLDTNGVPKLIDFGLVNSANSGTQYYAAPEVYEKQIHNGIDVWALGICLFASLCGFFPLKIAKKCDWRFEALLDAKSFCQSIFACYGLPCTFAQSVIDLLDGMMKVNTNERFTMSKVLEYTLTAKKMLEKNDDIASRPVVRISRSKRSLSE